MRPDSVFTEGEALLLDLRSLPELGADSRARPVLGVDALSSESSESAAAESARALRIAPPSRRAEPLLDEVEEGLAMCM